ncbi:unnamed protein product, partial [Ectocarpus sp. 6 AP-2014]
MGRLRPQGGGQEGRAVLRVVVYGRRGAGTICTCLGDFGFGLLSGLRRIDCPLVVLFSVVSANRNSLALCVRFYTCHRLRLFFVCKAAALLSKGAGSVVHGYCYPIQPEG